MIELTDSDREHVALISEADDSGVQRALLHDCYRAGMRAGIERAAKVCDDQRTPGNSGKGDEYADGCDAGRVNCAAAIRSLAK